MEDRGRLQEPPVSSSVPLKVNSDPESHLPSPPCAKNINGNSRNTVLIMCISVSVRAQLSCKRPQSPEERIGGCEAPDPGVESKPRCAWERNTCSKALRHLFGPLGSRFQTWLWNSGYSKFRRKIHRFLPSNHCKLRNFCKIMSWKTSSDVKCMIFKILPMMYF